MIWLITAWTLAALAAALLAWSLFWDRARGRRRCPKCWYDMSGAAADEAGAFTCPECGRTATTERKLRKTRRRWLIAWCALLVLLPAMQVVSRTSHVRERGLVAALPAGLLILLTPGDNLANLVDLRGMTPLARFGAELDARADHLSQWHVRMIARRLAVARPQWGQVRVYPYTTSERLGAALSDAERERLEGHRYFITMDPLVRPLLARTLRCRFMGGAWLLAGPEGVHEEFVTVQSFVTDKSGRDRLAELSDSRWVIAAYDISDLCPPIYGRAVPKVERLVGSITPPGGVEIDYPLNTFYWGGERSADLIQDLLGSHRVAGMGLSRSNMSFQELPGRLIVWGPEEWVAHVSTVVDRKRRELTEEGP